MCIIILKENCLLLQLPINFSYTNNTRNGKHACMVPLSIMVMAIRLKFFPKLPFSDNSDFIEYTPKRNFSVNYKVICLKLFELIAGKHMQHISK